MPNAVGSREGWELNNVAGGVMVGMYPDHYAAFYM
jgi:hypothetical protein